MSPHDLAALRRQSEALLGGEEPQGSAEDLYRLVRELNGFLEEATLEKLASARKRVVNILLPLERVVRR